MADSGPGPLAAQSGRGNAQTTEPQRWQTAVARRSAEARATVPDLDYSVTAEVGAALDAARQHGCRLTAVWARALALALRANPVANGAYRDGRFERYERVNVGVLVATADAYTIPTLFDADHKTALELDTELTELTARAEAGELRAPELSGATFTLTDVGPLGIERSTPLIVAPQAGALATGSVQMVPIARNGAIVPAHTMTLTLACDHRILYGAAAGTFLRSIKDHLEEARL